MESDGEEGRENELDGEGSRTARKVEWRGSTWTSRTARGLASQNVGWVLR